VETYYNDNDLENSLIKRIFELEDILIKQQNEALNNIQEAQIIQKEKYDNSIKINKLKIGDKVLVAKSQLKNIFSAKLEEQFIGPFIIHDILPYGVYKLRNLEGKKVKDPVHGNRLKLYFDRPIKDLPVPQIIIQNNSTN
jgi:hypothetical protein